MNEIEELIIGLERPSPSSNLDARVLGLIHRSDRSQHVRERSRQWGLLVASSAVASLIGFGMGRNSNLPSVGDPTVSVSTTTSQPVESVANPTPDPPIVLVEEPANEVLARFIMPTKRWESLFGRGQIEDRSGSSSLE